MPTLDDRKAAILHAVVEEYIQSAQPVGSTHVARRGRINVSPATVRNDMVALEVEGYLHQPHTSAGRVPTDKGYRYFVDTLVDPGSLGTPQRQKVSRFFASASGALEEMLRDTTRLLSDLTDCAAVVIGPAHDAATVRSVQFVGLGGGHTVVVAVLSDGSVEKAVLELASAADDDRLVEASHRVTAAVRDSTLSAPAGLRASGDPGLDALCATAMAALVAGHASDGDPVFVDGASRMAAAFDALGTVRQVLGILEQQYVVVGLLRDCVDRGLNVAIGAEHGLEPLAECSIVVAPFTVEGERAGTIGVLGPTRMHYARALAAVATVGDRLGEALREH